MQDYPLGNRGDHKTTQWFDHWRWMVTVERRNLEYGMIAQK